MLTGLWRWMVLRVFLVRLGLACLLACWGGIHVSLWWGGVWDVWCGWVAGRAVLSDTAVHLPARTWGHRTHQTTILLEVSLSFSLSLQGFLFFVCWF